MSRDDRETYEVMVPAGELLYANVYEPIEYHGRTDRAGGTRAWYSATVLECFLRDAGLDAAALGRPTRSIKGREGQFVDLRSHWRPEVKPLWHANRSGGRLPNEAVDHLVTELARLQARNVSLSRVFEDRPVMLEVQVFPYNNNYVGPGNFLALTGVRVYL